MLNDKKSQPQIARTISGSAKEPSARSQKEFRKKQLQSPASSGKGYGEQAGERGGEISIRSIPRQNPC